jgi:hypothetical protein
LRDLSDDPEQPKNHRKVKQGWPVGALVRAPPA